MADEKVMCETYSIKKGPVSVDIRTRHCSLQQASRLMRLKCSQTVQRQVLKLEVGMPLTLPLSEQ